MNKRFVVLGAMLGVATLGWADTKKEDAADRLDNAAKVLHEIMGTPDKGIPSEVLEHAKCIAVVPHMVKGGFVLGAEGGKGVATCRTEHGWSAPAFFTIEGGSWGLQIGVEGIDLVMVVQNDQGMEHLINSKFGGGRPGGSSCVRGNGLENERGNSDVLAGQGCVRGADPEWGGGQAGQGFDDRRLWS